MKKKDNPIFDDEEVEKEIAVPKTPFGTLLDDMLYRIKYIYPLGKVDRHRLKHRHCCDKTPEYAMLTKK